MTDKIDVGLACTLYGVFVSVYIYAIQYDDYTSPDLTQRGVILELFKSSDLDYEKLMVGELRLPNEALLIRPYTHPLSQ
jgi:hypothetical protein